MIKRIISSFLSVVCLLGAIVFVSSTEFNVSAYNYEDDSRVIVSMGDSYSAGEGLHDYYGSNPTYGRKDSQDFLSHRSENSWPAQLYCNSSKIKTMKDVKDDDWFFVAMSGAITNNIVGGKNVTKDDPEGNKYRYKDYLERYSLPTGQIVYVSTNRKEIDLQIDVFDDKRLRGKEIDFVTMTIGGNDVDFAGIVQTLIHPSCLYPNAIYDKITETYGILPEVAEDLKEVYLSVAEKAGSQVHIIVAGYPQLLEPSGKGALISANEAQVVNNAIVNFNRRIEATVKECSVLHNIRISFVPIDFSGHEIYSEDPWLYNYEWIIKYDDISDFSFTNGTLVSSASFHPNPDGAAEYARLVNNEIERIENEDKKTNVIIEPEQTDTVDIATESYQEDFINALINNPNAWKSPSGYGERMSFADLNSDGKLELISAYNPGTGGTHAEVYGYDNGNILHYEPGDTHSSSGYVDDIDYYYDSIEGRYRVFALDGTSFCNGHKGVSHYELDILGNKFYKNFYASYCWVENEYYRLYRKGTPQGEYVEGVYNYNITGPSTDGDAHDAYIKEKTNKYEKVEVTRIYIISDDWQQYSDSEKRDALMNSYSGFSYN